MSKFYAQAFYRLAIEDYREKLMKSRQMQAFREAAAQIPHLWDSIALRLGDWLIKLGYNLKSHSLLANKHA